MNKFSRYECLHINEMLIRKIAKINNLDYLAEDDIFIRDAANWSYTNYGYGTASLFGYLDFLENKPENLYRSNNALWRILRNKIFKRDYYTCQYCGDKGGKLEVDHIIPISKGGNNDLSNLNTSCRKCNRSKYNKNVNEFIEENGLQKNT
jgi:hypothetical protein